MVVRYSRPLRPDELMHFGVLGMKWGVRRYQNPDGTLTEAGKKHYSKEYQKLMIKSQKRLDERKLYVDAYNKAANYMNNGGLDEFHKKHKFTDKDYYESYEREFNNLLNNYRNDLITDHITNDKYAKAGHELAKKYGLYKYDALAIDNKKVYDMYSKKRTKTSPTTSKNQSKLIRKDQPIRDHRKKLERENTKIIDGKKYFIDPETKEKWRIY